MHSSNTTRAEKQVVISNIHMNPSSCLGFCHQFQGKGGIYDVTDNISNTISSPTHVKHIITAEKPDGSNNMQICFKFREINLLH